MSRLLQWNERNELPLVVVTDKRTGMMERHSVRWAAWLTGVSPRVVSSLLDNVGLVESATHIISVEHRRGTEH